MLRQVLVFAKSLPLVSPYFCYFFTLGYMFFFSKEQTFLFAGGSERNAQQQQQQQPATSESSSSDSASMPAPSGLGPSGDKPRGKGRPAKSGGGAGGVRGVSCPVCGKNFNNSSALAKHKLTHSDERKYVCPVCSKAFKRQDHL